MALSSMSAPSRCHDLLPLWGCHSGETLLSCDLVTSACGRKRCHGGSGLHYASSLPWSGVVAAGGRLSWTARSHSFFTVM